VPGRVTTFYSHKGGAGRTMALANIAVLLAESGKSVLAIDWDLEAPGLHRFLHDGDEHEQRPGLLELFTSVRALLPSVSDGARSTGRAAKVWKHSALERYVAPTQVKDLSIMRAGSFGDGYQSRVNALNWEQLYRDAPDVFSSFAEYLAERYEYVLVDSRTGITDAGGICTMLLPDRLVLVFTPNRQSLDGVVDRARQATAYRARSPDLRPLLVLPLASRVELSEEELRHEWRHGEQGYQPTFERLFGELYDLPECRLTDYFDEVQIQHAARFAYGEPLAVREERASDRLSLARSYASFARVLADGAIPWEFRRPVVQPSAGSHDEVSAQLDATIEGLAFARRRARGAELQARLFQAACAVGGLFAAIFEISLDQAVYAPYLVAGGVLLAALVELFARLYFPPGRARAYGRALSALTREQRLFKACAGPYAKAAAPGPLLAERTDEILGTLDYDSWALHHLPATPAPPPAPGSRA